jgi:hypothetical protein
VILKRKERPQSNVSLHTAINSSSGGSSSSSSSSSSCNNDDDNNRIFLLKLTPGTEMSASADAGLNSDNKGYMNEDLIAES